ncbi:MAG: glycosyltransferase [Planctomycetota bacterium]
MGERSDAPRFGVIVPCRNEAAVVRRRLENLARLDWPQHGRPHRVVLVDDGSADATGELARSTCAELETTPGVRFEVLSNPGPHGKAHAMRLAIDALDDVDLLLLTDADVVFRPGTPQALAEAFRADPALAMACGAQEFVASLPASGRESLDRSEFERAGEGYDFFTARVRALESRAGRLFSVHGQCLCWRADLGLRPLPGFAADDLDLRQQARAAGGAVRLVPGARFLEEKIADAQERDRQALRRAEAYFQFVRRTPHAAGVDWLDRLHWRCYRHLPELSGWLGVPATIALVAALTVWIHQSTGGGDIAYLEAAAVLLSGLLILRVHRVCRWIRLAGRRERQSLLTDSWETSRA